MTSFRCGLSACCSKPSRAYRECQQIVWHGQASPPHGLEPASRDGKDAPTALHIIIQPPHVTPTFPSRQKTERRFAGAQCWYPTDLYFPVSTAAYKDARCFKRM